MRVVGFALLAGLISLAAAASAAPAPEENGAEGAAPGSRIEKQIESLEKKLAGLQEEEIRESMAIMQAQARAAEGLKEPGKVTEELAKGNNSKEYREFKVITLGCANRLQAFNRKLAPLLKSATALERERGNVPEGLKARIDTVVQQVQGKYRTNLGKIASMYEQTASWGPAIQIYSKLYNDLPEKERQKDKETTKKLAELYNRVGDYRKSLVLYKGLFEAKKPKDRYNDKDLGEKVADLYAKCGDIRSALTVYRAVYAAIPADKREKDGQGIRDRIKELEKKSGRPSRG